MSRLRPRLEPRGRGSEASMLRQFRDRDRGGSQRWVTDVSTRCQCTGYTSVFPWDFLSHIERCLCGSWVKVGIEPPVGWLRGSVVEHRSLAGELSLSCSRPVVDR